MEIFNIKIILMAFILLTLFSLNTLAQEAEDFSQWSLPEDAKKRVGKGWVAEIKYSPDGTRLAAASSIGIWIYDTATFEEVALLSAHTEEVTALAYSSSGNVLASGSWDTTIRLWDPETGESLQTLRDIGAVSVA